MRTITSLLALAFAGCGCREYRDATDHFQEAMIAKASDPARFRAEMEQALADYQRSLAECNPGELERVRTFSMIARCLLELDRFSEADRVIHDMGEALDKRFGRVELSGDRLGIDFFRAEYLILVGRRALQGIQEASTDTYSEMKLHLALPYYEEALKLFRAIETTNDPEISRYAVLRDAQATLELARGYVMPKTPAARKNYERGRDLLAGALEKVKAHAGPPLQEEFDKLRPLIVKDLDWVDSELKK